MRDYKGTIISHLPAEIREAIRPLDQWAHEASAAVGKLGKGLQPNQTNTIINQGVTIHSQLQGLSADDHLQYTLLTGRVGGQTICGITSGSSGLLKLQGAPAGSGSSSIGFVNIDAGGLVTIGDSNSGTVLSVLGQGDSRVAIGTTHAYPGNLTISTNQSANNAILMLWAQSLSTGPFIYCTSDRYTNTPFIVDYLGQTKLLASNTTAVPLSIYGATAQTANLLSFYYNNTPVSYVNRYGQSLWYSPNTTAAPLSVMGASDLMHIGNGTNSAYPDLDLRTGGTKELLFHCDRATTGITTLTFMSQNAAFSALPVNFNNARVNIQGGSSVVPLGIIKNSLAPAADLTCWYDSNGSTVLARVTSSGDASFASISGSGASLTNIPETAITNGTLLARVADNETITGNWTVSQQNTSVTPFTIIDKNDGLAAADIFTVGPSGAANFRVLSMADPTFPGFTVALNMAVQGAGGYAIFDASALTTDRTFAFPNLGGTLALSGLNGLLKASTISSGVAFVDNSDATKTLRFRTAGNTTGKRTLIQTTATADRTISIPDKTGNMRIGTFTTKSEFIPYVRWVDPITPGYPGLSAVGSAPDVATFFTALGTGDTYFSTYFRVPADYLSTPVFTLHWANGGTSANTVKWLLTYAVVNAGTVTTTSGTTSNLGAVAPSTTAHATINTDFTWASTPTFSAGDLVRLTLRRDGTDTSTDSMEFYGLTFTFTPDM